MQFKFLERLVACGGTLFLTGPEADKHVVYQQLQSIRVLARADLLIVSCRGPMFIHSVEITNEGRAVYHSALARYAERQKRSCAVIERDLFGQRS